ncbi:MAG TPA: Hpt domain-containing protein [Xanthobacteraceae bacterium]|nr:Hpt domain-containing protein [Xanthobacteraceae bacterium]
MAELAAKNARERVEIDVAAEAPPLAPAAPVAIDRVHLARMTQGERDLEREVLQLYVTQADILLCRMGQSPSAAIAALAHTLKGSSRGIGAWQVADAAAVVEADAVEGRDTAASVERLAAAIRAAQVDIAELVRG